MSQHGSLVLAFCGLVPVACLVPSIDTKYTIVGGSAGAGGQKVGSAGASFGGHAGSSITTGIAGVASNIAGASSTGGLPSTGGTPNGSGGTPNGSGGTITEAGSNSTQGGDKATGGVNSTTGGSMTAGRSSTGGSATSGGIGTGGSMATGGRMNAAGTGAVSGGEAGAATVPGVPTELAVGFRQACALIVDGTVWCWGNNFDGQLGNGAPYGTDLAVVTSSTVPVQVRNLGQASAIATGVFHSCAVVKSGNVSGNVKCWGNNEAGQLGDGGAGVGQRSNLPVDVKLSGATATAVVAGESHSCALNTDQTVKCWGDNSSCQLGNGSVCDGGALASTVVTNASTKTPLGGVTSLASSRNHTCAVLTDRSVYCWGQNDYGQLGAETPIFSSIAIKVGGVEAQAIAVGEEHTCAVSSAASGVSAVECWGNNWSGQLGDNTDVASVTPVLPGVNASAIGVGASHTCAVLAGGAVTCWGRNNKSQLGDQSQVNRYVPTPVPSFTQATRVGGGDLYSCALVSGGRIYCWGDNSFGQLGDGNGQYGLLSLLPVRVTGF
jgi:alpha-tubulin suppressor-like RCC1 family protein